jgi:hypothetical protein
MNTRLDRRAVRQRLKWWAKWRNQLLVSHLDYANQSIIDKLRKSGGLMVKTTGDIHTPENKETEAVDALINRLRRFKPGYARILLLHYTRVDDYEDIVKQSEMKRSTYYKHLRKAEEWVMERL